MKAQTTRSDQSLFEVTFPFTYERTFFILSKLTVNLSVNMKYLYKLIKVVYSTLTLLSNFLKYTFKWHISIFGQTLLTIEGKVLVV